MNDPALAGRLAQHARQLAEVISERNSQKPEALGTAQRYISDTSRAKATKSSNSRTSRVGRAKRREPES